MVQTNPVLAAQLHVLPHVARGNRKRTRPLIRRLVAARWRPERIVSFILHWLKSAQDALAQMILDARLAPVLPQSGRADAVATPPPIPPPFIPSKTTIYTNAPNS
jgi:hypothetical protein